MRMPVIDDVKPSNVALKPSTNLNPLLNLPIKIALNAEISIDGTVEILNIKQMIITIKGIHTKN